MVEKDEHEKAVNAFMQECQKTRPDEYEEVCLKHPIITYKRMKTIKEREVPMSILEDE